MATQLQLRHGNTAQNDAFTGAPAEVTVDTQAKGLRLHDGTKQGGYHMPALVAFQLPSASNGNTWYRKYSDGWVEQGGIVIQSVGTTTTVTLPIPMSSTTYNIYTNCSSNNTELEVANWKSRTTTQITVSKTWLNQGTPVWTGGEVSWLVAGIAAN